MRDLRRAVDANRQSGYADPAPHKEYRILAACSGRNRAARKAEETFGVGSQEAGHRQAFRTGPKLHLPSVIVARENHFATLPRGRRKNLRSMGKQKPYLPRLPLGKPEGPREVGPAYS